MPRRFAPRNDFKVYSLKFLVFSKYKDSGIIVRQKKRRVWAIEDEIASLAEASSQ